MTLALKINGHVRQVQADLADTLLTVLRDQLQLTAAKRGCNQGVCGACTVMIDGRPQRACLSPGVLISAHWLLAQTPKPTTDEIRAGLSGNLCRCTGYRKIVDAVASAAGGKP